MYEYLSYQLWRQREERLPRELEHDRVVEERLREQQLELRASRLVNVPSRDEYVLVDE